MITDTGTLDALHKALDDHPDDWGTRLMLADYLEEQGEDGPATALRWQVRRRKRPRRFASMWLWYDESRVSAYDPESNLPSELWKVIDKEPSGRHGPAKEWDTRRAAEEALWQAWIIWQQKDG